MKRALGTHRVASNQLRKATVAQVPKDSENTTGEHCGEEIYTFI